MHENMKSVFILFLFFCTNLAAQSVEEGVFAVISFERVIMNKTESYYWIVPQDSILSKDNGRFCLYPLYLSSEEKPTWTPLANGNGDLAYCLSDSFCQTVSAHHEMVQKIQTSRLGTVYKNRAMVEGKIKEKTTVYLTFVSGRFITGTLLTENVINRGFPLKAYAPTGDIQIVRKEPDDRVYQLAKTTDYQGIAYSITQLIYCPYDREASKAYQAPYQ